MDVEQDKIALIDLDGTVANFDKALSEQMKTLQAPNEPLYGDRYTGGIEPDYISARRKMIQRQPGFWRDLEPIMFGFEVVEELRALKFGLHVLTKGPQSNSGAWAEKLEWARKWLPDATVTITGEKSLVYGRILFDDFPPYFMKWLGVRPRGLVICLAHPWNLAYAKGGSEEHPNVLRYDGKNFSTMRAAVRRAYEREAKEMLEASL